MNINIIAVLGFFGIVLLAACSPQKDSIQREFDFNDNWRFFHSDVNQGQSSEFNDDDWRLLDLPHDFSIEDIPSKEGIEQVGPFTKESEGGASTGHVLGGTAWYRKHFTLSKKDEGKIVKVLFDGIYMNADVWINGHHLGNHPYGYTAFHYDLTKFLNEPGEENVLAVQVKNEGKNSRWYSGSGIYRNVILIKTNPVYIDVWGNYTRSSEVTKESAKVSISSQLVNATDQDMNVKMIAELQNIDGEVAGNFEKETSVKANGKNSVTGSVNLINPHLWSIDEPTLYTLNIKIYADGKLLDHTSEKIGVLSIEFSPENGFLLNGENVLLKGACLHHDNGILGAAAFDRAEYRKVRIMKEYGYNAIRTAHNPPSKAFLDACDAFGMLVIDESFDQWQIPKNDMDYNLYFDDWWERDMESMLLRDRNHPSIIMWSYGNEIKERADSSGLAIAEKLVDKIQKLDPTRPATQAICKFWEFPGRGWEDTAPAFELMDVHSYNYQWQQYEEDHKKYPNRIMLASESFGIESFENWQKVKKLPYVIGNFVWTGMDYFGESGIGHASYSENKEEAWNGLPPWPWFNANCGGIDILGSKKPQGVYKDVVWGNSDLEMAVHKPVPEGIYEHLSPWAWPLEEQSWNWEGSEGVPLRVSVYSNYEEIRLELNGKVIDIQPASEDTRLTASFTVPYEPGELTAIAIKDGKEVLRKTLKTAGKAYQLQITPERKTIQASNHDLAYFNVEILDEEGLFVPNAELPVAFNIQGRCKMQAVGNGNPTGLKSFQQPKVKTFRGRCQLIVRSCTDGDEIVVSAKSEGLKMGEAKVLVQ